MRRLRSAPNLAIATLWVDLLGQAGIAATVQRAFASSIAGELPPDQALPEVWVQHEEQFERARAALDELTHCPQRLWVCPGCAERIDGPFEQCWNCGGAMPLTP
ncbi:DUF2007 domain-containing protein [Methylibium sp.]|uniref:putative signal transducing protein n=1 Tax=Methylibium sp. TaxID=2067992 RepID=UPI003D143B4D